MTTSNELTNRLLVSIPAALPNVRVWRRNVGAGYPSSVVRSALVQLHRGDIAGAIRTLSCARPVKFGLEGEPDLDGFAGPSGRRLGVEIKAGKDKQSEAQQVCQQVYERHGAVYLVARDVEQAIADLRERIK